MNIVTETMAEKIWNELKDENITIFALPNQKVNMYCKPVSIEPNKLYLLPTIGIMLPTLEKIVKNKYFIEKIDKYIVISELQGQNAI